MESIKIKHKPIPKEWFFFNPINKAYDKYFFKISNRVGVIFFYNIRKEKELFLKLLEPYILWCKIKKIQFIIQSSIYWANKYKALGIFIDSQSFSLNDNLNISYLKKKFLIAGKVHNVVEAKKFNSFYNLVFISNAYRTNSHPGRASLSRSYFLKICFILRSNLNFALGGVNAINFKKLKNKHLYGFGAISYFKE
tara:strand:+ start:134 stop:718 length:585 start_codon:yes stop_codon:yes gene_type:complete